MDDEIFLLGVLLIYNIFIIWFLVFKIIILENFDEKNFYNHAICSVLFFF